MSPRNPCMHGCIYIRSTVDSNKVYCVRFIKVCYLCATCGAAASFTISFRRLAVVVLLRAYVLAFAFSAVSYDNSKLLHAIELG